jgi:hypothetical protein
VKCGYKVRESGKNEFDEWQRKTNCREEEMRNGRKGDGRMEGRKAWKQAKETKIFTDKNSSRESDFL